MLSKKETALLMNKLQVPGIIADILNGRETLTDDVHYALHGIISDMQPDSALLAIALSAETLARIYANASPGMKVLGLECERIVADYGSLWLRNAQEEIIDEDAILDALMHTPEDLESLAELLELCGSFLKAKDKSASALCDLLYIQAKAHAMIADEFIATANEAANKVAIIRPEIPALASNVIPFPASR